MTYKEKLIELLKTVPEIKEDLEELKFWTRIEINWWKMFFKSIIIDAEHIDYWIIKYITRHPLYYFLSWKDKEFKINKWELKIIWNPLEERHLRMYCEKNTTWIIIRSEWDIVNILQELFITKLDNTKSFDNQEDKVYESLFNYLNN